MANTRWYSAGETSMKGMTGTWALNVASNVFSFLHSTAADTSVVGISIPKPPFGLNWQNAPSIIKVAYTVGTADLSSAPTAVLDKQTWSSSTGVVTRAAVTQAITFGGVDAVGVANGAGAAGTHIAIVTVTSPAQLGDNEAYFLELTMVAAATSVLAISGFEVTYS